MNHHGNVIDNLPYKQQHQPADDNPKEKPNDDNQSHGASHFYSSFLIMRYSKGEAIASPAMTLDYLSNFMSLRRLRMSSSFNRLLNSMRRALLVRSTMSVCETNFNASRAAASSQYSPLTLKLWSGSPRNVTEPVTTRWR